MTETISDEQCWPSRVEHSQARDILIEYINGIGCHAMASIYSLVSQKEAAILIDGKEVCRYEKGKPWWELQTHNALATERLNRAAPELLKACKLLLFQGGNNYACYCNDPDYQFNSECDKCDNCIAASAIAKAEGGNK